tara:strand:- start:406 stop:1512 length:1107 start_codon:yes stop_codon:yes gene_type:complete
MKKININANSGRYPVYVGPNILKKIGLICKKNKVNFEKSLIIIDNKLSFKYTKIIKKSLKLKKTFIYSFKSNEKNKNIFEINKVINNLLKNNFSRNDCIIALGGGIVGDFSSFAASIYKRGLSFINVPTTLLSQVDACIGGKNGVNDNKFGKNLIGTFYQPKIVISDSKFLETLSTRQIICGYAEMLKHSLVASKKNFEFLKNNYKKILKTRSPFIDKAILMSCKIKKNIVEQDEKEQNLRKILNFGHTFGHAYEAASGFKNNLNHGEGVMLGMKTAIKFSLEKKIIDFKTYDKILSHINHISSDLTINKFFQKKDINKLVRLMQNDKKNKNSKINLILLKNISKPIISKDYSPNEIKKFFENELINF